MVYIICTRQEEVGNEAKLTALNSEKHYYIIIYTIFTNSNQKLKCNFIMPSLLYTRWLVRKVYMNKLYVHYLEQGH